MSSPAVGGGKSGYRLNLIVVLALVLVTGVARSEGGYQYQTHPTQYSPNAARYDHVSVRLGNGQVGIFAGAGRTDAELFDPNTEQFTASRATRTFTDFAGGTLPDGTALLVDGLHDCIYDYTSDAYVAAQDTFTGSLARLPVLVPLADGKVFACGGYGPGYAINGECEVYDPRAMRFTALADLAVPRVYHAAVLMNDYQVLVVGGYGAGGSLGSLEVYDTNRGGSALIRTALFQARHSHCVVRLSDGRILIAGGASSTSGSLLASTEIFDPNTSVLVEGPSLGLPRSSAQAVTLPSGRIAFFGGNSDARTVEIYCPETDTFELASCLTVDPHWSGFTATTLDSGGVLLVGGRADAAGTVVQSAEIFEEVEADGASATPMTVDAIRALLADSDPAVVSEASERLVSLGEQVVSILNTLVADESSSVSRQAASILDLIAAENYPEIWCVEICNESGVLDTVWLSSFDCPDLFEAGKPPASYTAIVRATAGADFTNLVVRFPPHASYENRVELFNLVGWTGIADVTLGADLTEDEWTRATGSK
ncbi:MAG TPA: hypothetical protein PKH24_10155 [Sedimentisphaerales bacterium]|jgi:hypothetical protein|nr:hypothetical protein [Sedimentisphaerales bacterium]HNU29467.1 hypothetical protein [Sedimentisphaerales bacterium]